MWYWIVSISAVVAALAGVAVYLALRARELARERDEWIALAEREQREHFGTLAEAYFERARGKRRGDA